MAYIFKEQIAVPWISHRTLPQNLRSYQPKCVISLSVVGPVEQATESAWSLGVRHQDLLSYLTSLEKRNLQGNGSDVLIWLSIIQWQWCQSLSHAQLFVISWTIAHWAPLSMEFSRQEYWSGLPCCSPRDHSNPGIKPRFPAWQVDSLSFELPGIPFSVLFHFCCNILHTSRPTEVQVVDKSKLVMIKKLLFFTRN